jgi:hypothetical protein
VRTVVSGVVGIARFLYRFVVGDDWTVAVAILLALTATGLLEGRTIPVWWLVPVVAIVMTGVSLRGSARR